MLYSEQIQCTSVTVSLSLKHLTLDTAISMLKKLLKIVHQMQARNPYDDVDGKHSNRFIVVSYFLCVCINGWRV